MEAAHPSPIPPPSLLLPRPAGLGPAVISSPRLIDPLQAASPLLPYLPLCPGRLPLFPSSEPCLGRGLVVLVVGNQQTDQEAGSWGDYDIQFSRAEAINP